jgi:uncharacterized protein YkwD
MRRLRLVPLRRGEKCLVAVGAMVVVVALVCAAAGMAQAWHVANAGPISTTSSLASKQEYTPASDTSAPQPGNTTAPVHDAPTPSTSGSSTANGCQITAQDIAGERYLLGVLNAHRAAAGVAPLSLSATVSRASRQHSCDMFQQQQLSHIGSDGSSPFARIRATGVALTTAGENIGDTNGYAMTQGLDLIDRDMMAEPLTRGNHHWNIVNPAYTQVGLGVIYSNGEMWFTEDFAG